MEGAEVILDYIETGGLGAVLAFLLWKGSAALDRLMDRAEKREEAVRTLFTEFAKQTELLRQLVERHKT